MAKISNLTQTYKGISGRLNEIKPWINSLIIEINESGQVAPATLLQVQRKFDFGLRDVEQTEAERIRQEVQTVLLRFGDLSRVIAEDGDWIVQRLKLELVALDQYSLSEDHADKNTIESLRMFGLATQATRDGMELWFGIQAERGKDGFDGFKATMAMDAKLESKNHLVRSWVELEKSKIQHLANIGVFEHYPDRLPRRSIGKSVRQTPPEFPKNDFDVFRNLRHLEILNLYGASISAESAASLENFPSLK